MKIISVVGARPNFMKIAPIVRAIKKHGGIHHILVHTGQHYDYEMSGSFFKELGIPHPDINLEIGSASHARQAGLIMMEFEKVLLKEKPDVVIVVGDVNSTMACSLVATKLGIAVAHVEAGLRSFDRNMPEEINRLVTDSVADILFTTSLDANIHLRHEGILPQRIFFVGNVMIDTLLNSLTKARKTKILERMGLQKETYTLVTLHRPSNVDDKNDLSRIMQALGEIQKSIKVIFPVHPRTKNNIQKYYSASQLKKWKNLQLIEPLGYFDFLNLMSYAKVVLTDSGGIQEETTVLGIPCLTLRNNTERPVTITQGTNILVGTDKKRIIRESQKILQGKIKNGQRPKYWDGNASQRIVQILVKLYQQKQLRRV